MKGAISETQARALEHLYGNDPSVSGFFPVPMFRRVLDSDTQIRGETRSILSDGTVGNMPVPTGYWKLDETGATVPTATVGGYSGAAGAGLVKGATTMLNTQGGTSYTFTGANNSYADLTSGTGNFGLAGLAPFTLSFWMKPNGAPGGTVVLMGKADSSTGPGWSVLLAAGSIRLRRSDGTTQSDITYNYTPPNGVKQHVCIVYAGNVAAGCPWIAANNTTVIYLDGVEVARGVHSTLATGITGNSSFVTLGTNGAHSGGAYTGDIDEVAIWSGGLASGVLSPDQVYSLYQAGANAPG